MKNIVVFLIGLFLIFMDKSYALIEVGLLGLLSDLVVGGIVGITALLFMAASYFISTVEKSIFKDKKLIVLFLVFVISIVYSIINAVVSAIFYVPVPLILVLLKGVILIPLLNVGVAFLAYSLFGDLLMKLREE